MENNKVLSSCDIVQDLLPLYMENSLSKDSHYIVEKHMQECPSCCKIREMMSEDIALDIGDSVVDYPNKIGKLVRRTILIVLVGIFLVVFGVCAVGIWYAWPLWHGLY